MRNSNYDKYPTVKIGKSRQPIFSDWEAISMEISCRIKALTSNKSIVVLETYPGVREDEVLKGITTHWNPDKIFDASNYYKTGDELEKMLAPDVTDDRVFGFMTRHTIKDFFSRTFMNRVQWELDKIEEGAILVYGSGAIEIAPHPNLFIYADLARWEIQQRMRNNEVGNLGCSNHELEIARKYKRAYFVDWRVADRIKRATWGKWDFVLDTNKKDKPVMVHKEDYHKALSQAVSRPFRVVPFFDPGPWGGQWMKEVCDLDRDVVNYAWCFDCVPEENSLLLDFDGVVMESPSINLVFFETIPLLGERVYARFGAEFPIRFDFLDTFGGGNLSLQVHPVSEYIREHFGMFYTQDESYYLLDAGDDAVVYLGLQEGIEKEDMLQDLRAAQNGGPPFDADKYVAKWQAKKHDHFLIPAGTIHCSGENCMVLEISATPYIFTFKLWDWGRLGMDGQPRPINIDHGENVMQWDRTEYWVKENLINTIEPLLESEGIKEERTGLHEFEFIETRRHWFSEPVIHEGNGSVHVLNLIEGDEVVVDCPNGTFEPFTVHYAETFIVPASIKTYRISPAKFAENQSYATIKAFVKN